MRSLLACGLAVLSIVALAPSSASATPIVVMRTKNGYIVATNASRDKEGPACKMQYNSRQVTLHAAPISVVKITGDQTLFDANSVIWSVYATAQDYISIGKLAEALRTSLAKDAELLKRNPIYEFQLVNVSALGVWPFSIAIRMDDPGRWLGALAPVFRQPFALQEGEALVWILSHEPTRKREQPTLEGVRRLLDSGIPEGDRANFGPPYLIGELDGKGFHFLTADGAICTADHPAPIVTVPRRKRRSLKAKAH